MTVRTRAIDFRTSWLLQDDYELRHAIGPLAWRTYILVSFDEAPPAIFCVRSWTSSCLRSSSCFASSSLDFLLQSWAVLTLPDDSIYVSNNEVESFYSKITILYVNWSSTKRNVSLLQSMWTTWNCVELWISLAFGFTSGSSQAQNAWASASVSKDRLPLEKVSMIPIYFYYIYSARWFYWPCIQTFSHRLVDFSASPFSHSTRAHPLLLNNQLKRSYIARYVFSECLKFLAISWWKSLVRV